MKFNEFYICNNEGKSNCVIVRSIVEELYEINRLLIDKLDKKLSDDFIKMLL